jgi:hypothetical protein
MPWFPEFTSAVELARRQTQAAGKADPVAQYFIALNKGDTHALETVWPGEVVIYDPRAGEVRGRRPVRQFIRHNMSWLAAAHASPQIIASTVVDGRAVVELLAHLDHEGTELIWPVAVVAESPDDQSVVFRTYCSPWPVYEHREIRAPILPPADLQPGDIVGRYYAGLAAGDVEAVLSAFAPDGYFRGPFGSPARRGTAELRSFYAGCFGAGGGIGLEFCAVTDDGMRCAVEYNCVSWGRHELPPQAGIGVYERRRDGLLAAARIYDDIQAPPPAGPA